MGFRGGPFSETISEVQKVPAVGVCKAVCFAVGCAGEALETGGGRAEDVADPNGEVDVVFEDQCAGEVFVDDLAPDVGVGSPAPDFGGGGRL